MIEWTNICGTDENIFGINLSLYENKIYDIKQFLKDSIFIYLE